MAGRLVCTPCSIAANKPSRSHCRRTSAHNADVSNRSSNDSRSIFAISPPRLADFWRNSTGAIWGREVGENLSNLSWEFRRSTEHYLKLAREVRLRRTKCRVSGYYGVASRDRVLEFGKFKGAMLGTMSSKYLKWLVKNLEVGPMAEWSTYAEEVLADAYYKDRLEWEKVEKLLTVAHDINAIAGNRDVLAPAKVYGWDLEDDTAWRGVNFALLGTTQGGRIPRTKGVVAPAAEEARKRTSLKKPVPFANTSTVGVEDSRSSGSLRDELMRRRSHRRDRLMANRGGLSGKEDTVEGRQQKVTPFPGRESLLSSVRSYDISE